MRALMLLFSCSSFTMFCFRLVFSVRRSSICFSYCANWAGDTPGAGAGVSDVGSVLAPTKLVNAWSDGFSAFGFCCSTVSAGFAAGAWDSSFVASSLWPQPISKNVNRTRMINHECLRKELKPTKFLRPIKPPNNSEWIVDFSQLVLIYQYTRWKSSGFPKIIHEFCSDQP